MDGHAMAFRKPSVSGDNKPAKSALSNLSHYAISVCGRLRVTTETTGFRIPLGSIVAVNHSSVVDPFVVAAALRHCGVNEPVALAAAGLWKVPLLGRQLRSEGHIPVRRGSGQGNQALDLAAQALSAGRIVVIYPEGGLPRRRGAAEEPPRVFRSGLARLALASHAPVVPLGHVGSRAIAAGGSWRQLADVATAPARRPWLSAHFGEPLTLDRPVPAATQAAHDAVTAAWQAAAAAHLDTDSTGRGRLGRRWCFATGPGPGRGRSW
ncbi:lysophospholipid acyltransferase family protein [Streptomyces sp. NPDC051577]|uniref:lysophospholipid acyltransferase family protein n=1 Tax=Streptomyces sp. NPDC051577 TaxID=3155166 RepID=UPI0034383C4A